MRDLTPRQSRTVSLLLLSTVVFMAGARAHATVPVTQYVVIQPIDVCGTSGPSSTTGCAPFNDQSASPNPSMATTTTPIGFVDAATNVNITRAIWLQAGIDVTFLPIAEYNNSNYQAIGDITCAGSTCTSQCFKALSSGTQPSPPCTDSAGTLLPLKASGCKSNCSVPLASAKANAINMFFVNSLTASTGGESFGFAWLNGNGIAIAANVFSFSSFTPSRFDTLAHEIGHNLDLDHFTFGATPCLSDGLQDCNVMNAGDTRDVPQSSSCSSSTSTDGALFDLGTGLCPASAGVPAVPLDQLISEQQAQALLSGFLNPVPNVNATAGGGDVHFRVAFNDNARPGAYIFALVLALPNGFKFSNNPFSNFTQTAGSTPVNVFGFQLLNGNSGQGNSNCVKPVSGAPAIECLEVDFDPSTFTQGDQIEFDSKIVFKDTGAEATAADLESACTPPSPMGCLDLTLAFNDLLAITSPFVAGSASTQFPDPSVSSAILDPTNFSSVHKLSPPLTLTGFTQTPCTPPIGPLITTTISQSSSVCPPLAHGDPGGPD